MSISRGDDLEDYLLETQRIAKEEADRLESKFGRDHLGAGRIIAKLRYDVAMIDSLLRGFQLSDFGFVPNDSV